MYTPFYTYTLCSSNTIISQFCDCIHAFVDAGLHSGLLNLYLLSIIFAHAILITVYALHHNPGVTNHTLFHSTHNCCKPTYIPSGYSCSSQSAWAIIARSYPGSPPTESLGTTAMHSDHDKFSSYVGIRL